MSDEPKHRAHYSTCVSALGLLCFALSVTALALPLWGYYSNPQGKVAHIDPLILYQRLFLQEDPTVTVGSTVDLSSYFKFEIAPFPMALLTSISMRKYV
ncbi:hypothetical protein GE061_006465 [Apolygus lucorum]|uniref:Uncharacterized protein n=1 Tax=Apolygus lucorum TaxID=248454 RepID=A0A8S9WVC1_APOLU|nr:hypothetical protein GE061_006465 [Apolygus lucorum]